jgi:hypothetical protein
MTSLLLAAALSAPVAHAEDPITIEPVAVENLQIGMGGGSFDLVLKASRNKGLPVTLRWLEYELLVGNVVVTENEREYDGVKLKKGEPATFSLPVKLDASTAFSAGAKAMSSGRLDLRLRGQAGLKVLIFPIRIEFDEELVTDPR